MAKTLKTTKDKLITLINVVDNIPAVSLNSEIDKHLSFRKAVKVHIQEYLDNKQKVQIEANNLQKEVNKKNQPLVDDIKKLEKVKEEERDQESITLKTEAVKKANESLVKKINEFNEKIASEFDSYKEQAVVVTFDNEAFLFESNLIKENATKLFKNGELFNAEFAEQIFDLLDSAD